MKPINNNTFYSDAIRKTFPYAWNVRAPIIPGGVCPVFLCDTPEGTIVCRFSSYNIAYRNKTLGDLLYTYNIPAPRTCVHLYGGRWFESYEYCPEQTLCEHMYHGISDKQMFDVYKQIIKIQKQISDIPVSLFKPIACKDMHQVFVENQRMRVQPTLARVYGAVHKLFSNHGEQRLFHNDLDPRNVLVDDYGNLTKLIDLDAIAVCNESFSVMMMLRVCPLKNRSELMDIYEDTMQRKINRPAITGGLKILNAIRAPQVALNRLLWHGYNTPPRR